MNDLLGFFKGKVGLDYSQLHLLKSIPSNPKLPPLTEVIAWEIKDFEDWMRKRGVLLIRQAKGKKDRITPLSGKLVELLRQYYVACKPYTWLFEGQI